MKNSISEHLVDTGRLWQLNSLNNSFVMKKLCAPADQGNPELEKAFDSWFSWWHWAAITMLGTRGTCTLCPGTHLCACRQQEARSYHAMSERKQRREEAAGAEEWGEAGRLDTGHGKESPGQKWMYYGTVSRPAARFCHFKWLTSCRNITVVIWDWWELHLSFTLVSTRNFQQQCWKFCSCWITCL